MRFRKAIYLTVACVSTTGAVHAEVADQINAIVGDSVITLQQILQRSRPSEETVAQESTTRPENELLSKIIALRQDEFKALMNDQVVLQEFKRLEKEKGAKVPDAFIDERMRLIIRDDPRFGGDRTRFDKYLEIEGMTREQFRNGVRDEIILEYMRQEFVKRPIISPLKVETYYKEHQDQYTIPARVKLHWIQRDKTPGETNGATREMMQEILSQIKDGADFDNLAKTYLQGPQHDDEWRELSTMSDEYQKALSKLKVGQCSDVIETSQGYLILKVTDLEGAHVSPLTDVRDAIVKDLEAREFNQRREDWIKKLRSRIFVQIF